MRLFLIKNKNKTIYKLQTKKQEKKYKHAYGDTLLLQYFFFLNKGIYKLKKKI